MACPESRKELIACYITLPNGEDIFIGTADKYNPEPYVKKVRLYSDPEPTKHTYGPDIGSDGEIWLEKV